MGILWTDIELKEMTVNQKQGRTYNVTSKSYDESGESGESGESSFMDDKLYYESEMTIVVKITQEIE